MGLARATAVGLALAGAPLGAGGQAAAPRLAFPLDCKIGVSCEIQSYMDRDPGPGVRDYRCGRRTYEGHGGVDIRIPDMAAQRRGVDVLAAAPGRVARLRDGVADISIRAPGAPSTKDAECGNGVVIDHGGGWETQYCHLARGSVKVKVGDQVVAGQPIAKVGLSGQTEFPHLHLTVRKGAEKVDPFAPAADAGAGCKAQAGLWTPAAAKAMSYKAAAVLNAGFAAAPVTMEALEAGGIAAPDAASPFLVAYVRAIGLQRGDVIELTVTVPGGAVLVTRREAPLAADKAQQFLMIGQKRPAAGWAKGSYRGAFRLHRDGAVAVSKAFELAL